MLAGTKPKEGFTFRRLDKPEEFRQLQEVHRLAWGLPEGEPSVPVALQRALQDNGGRILGAFADIYLAGFTLGFVGWDGAQLYHYSHMTAVRPEYQNHQVAFRLKAYQREEVLQMGLPEIRWTFDPLQSKNAMLNLRRLGAVPDRYLPHYYGQMSDTINRGLESDRVRVVWPITTPRVQERMEGRHPSPEEDARRWNESEAILVTDPGESGIRLPVEVREPSGRPAHLEIPFDLALVRAHEAESLRRWRHAVRDAFRAAFDLSYHVEDFAVVSTGHERRSFYFLAPKASASDGA